MSIEKVSDGVHKKSEHILKSGDFRTVYKNGRSFRKGGFALAVVANKLSHNRIGFSIGSAAIKRANRRNRFRRLFREFYRQNKALFKQAFDIVIIVRQDPGDSFAYKDAGDMFISLSKKAQILA